MLVCTRCQERRRVIGNETISASGARCSACGGRMDKAQYRFSDNPSCERTYK